MPPINPSKIPQLFQDARQKEARGDLNGARLAYQSILAADPKFVQGQFQIGQLYLKLQDWTKATEHLARAADLRPKETVIWQAYAHAVKQMQDPAQVKKLLDQAKRARIDRKLQLALSDHLRPTHSKPSIGSAPPADVDRLQKLVTTGQTAKALTLAKKLTAAHPDVALLHSFLAQALASSGNIQGAHRSFQKAIALDSRLVEALSSYGHFLLRIGQHADAVKHFAQALGIEPEHKASLLNLGTAFRMMHRVPAAERALNTLLSIDPDNTLARIEFGYLYLGDNRPEAALNALQPAIDAKTSDPIALTLYARALAALNRTDDAEQMFKRARKAGPNLVQPLADTALFYQHQGRFAESEPLFRKLISSSPRVGQHYQTFVTTKKLAADDPLIDQMMEQFESPDVTEESRSYFGFALAKAFEDSKQYDRVFPYLKRANDIVRAQYPYDVKERFDAIDAIAQAYADAKFELDPDAPAKPGTPIFVSGLPRSGTTLVEQIIASHSRVTGGGEIGYAREELIATLRNEDLSFRDWASVNQSEREAIGGSVLQRMLDRFPGADIITDKSVQTYTMIGPALAAIPGAKMVVVHRDPRDNLLSIYKNRFADGMHLYSYDLGDLGVYYQAFQRIIAFWREKLPGAFHEIHYEDLIANPEEETRKLIAACGLDWQDGCLSFHENKRRVDTLSVHQVRQPIYRSSVKAWKRYEADLQPLFEALDAPASGPPSAE